MLSTLYFHLLDLNYKKSIILNSKYRGFIFFLRGQHYLDFSTENILFLAPQRLEMKEWAQLLGSMFSEKPKPNNNSKFQTTNYTFSFKTGEKENPSNSFIAYELYQYLCK